MPSPIMARQERIRSLQDYIEKNPGTASSSINAVKLGIMLGVSPATVTQYFRELERADLIKWDFPLGGYKLAKENEK